MLRHGLERVLRALAVHSRQKASNGLTSPSQCFQKRGICERSGKPKKRWLSAFGPLCKTQIVLVFAMNSNGSPFSLTFAGVLHPHFNDYVRTLDKIDSPSTEFASSIFKEQHILLYWFLSSTDIFHHFSNMSARPMINKWWAYIFRNTKNLGKKTMKIDICLRNRSWNSWWSRAT